MTEEPSLIERLRYFARTRVGTKGPVQAACLEAACELSRLEGEVERLTHERDVAYEGQLRDARYRAVAEQQAEDAESALSAAETRAEKAEGGRDAALRELTKYAREAGEAKGRLEMSEAAGIVDGWRERAQLAEGRGKALVEAVEPFAAFAREVLTPGSPSYREWLETSNDWMVVFSFAGRGITLGDLRKFHAALPHVQSKEGLGGLPGQEQAITCVVPSSVSPSDGSAS